MHLHIESCSKGGSFVPETDLNDEIMGLEPESDDIFRCNFKVSYEGLMHFPCQEQKWLFAEGIIIISQDGCDQALPFSYMYTH